LAGAAVALSSIAWAAAGRAGAAAAMDAAAPAFRKLRRLMRFMACAPFSWLARLMQIWRGKMMKHVC
jgi:hypothetical protein